MVFIYGVWGVLTYTNLPVMCFDTLKHGRPAQSDRLVGLVVKASASRAEDPGFESRLRRDFFGSSHTSDFKLSLYWLPCQAPGEIGSVLGLVGPVSVYCDWVR